MSAHGERSRVPVAPHVVVVAEDEIRRRRLAAILDRGGVVARNHAGRAEDVLDGASVDAPAAAVIACRDLQDAVRTLVRLRELEHVRLVLVAPDAGSSDLRELFTAGADAVVLEEALETSLLPALAAVLSGQLVLPRAHRSHLAPPTLSAREKQVLGLVVLGCSNQEVATRLQVMPATVKSHLTSSFRKLGVRSRAEATTRILDPHQGLGLGILSITETDRSLDVFGES